MLWGRVDCNYLIIGLSCIEGRIDDANREERVIEAETTLREMVKAGFKPADDISIYTMVVDGFCTKLGDSQMCYRRLRKTDANLLSVGIVGTVGTYNVLINALFKRGQIENAE
ncbi:hypothetical protein JRO89_XS14G0020100 [Xanthoceras sorbifolium]|uniref:Pentatricopeptide repeat-containing protein n=1 Tax=Xanthoceras sorbifolium TaxID=99658 RepID=A0ABQ8H3C8_9ROSI|nr:hypothetical protein JRO89_XS14G0020100 [Xanthoceras sorbifolium]